MCVHDDGRGAASGRRDCVAHGAVRRPLAEVRAQEPALEAREVALVDEVEDEGVRDGRVAREHPDHGAVVGRLLGLRDRRHVLRARVEDGVSGVDRGLPAELVDEQLQPAAVAARRALGERRLRRCPWNASQTACLMRARSAAPAFGQPNGFDGGSLFERG